ncbi:MAG: TonB-dependent receptor [Flavobacterium sp.]|uniref:TonB-dependent receptor n=1 Tax=Flavobacterium sp. TaxID=239 RepID=UPI0011F61975|nr:TonB-dependent receptor [Flavobacterium sp.]RZJ67835.1 MAG: TonB-dependent receptor [Flavobacterium sp.]
MLVRSLFLLLLLLPCCAFSQTRGKVALKIVLDEIAQQHQVRFSYIDEELVVYKIVPPDSKIPLSGKIDYIQAQTRLRIEAVSGNYYTIFNDRKMDKPLCGYLIDADGKGIENANIVIEDSPYEATSNADGYFELPVLSPNAISIRHLGYKPMRIEPQDLYVNDCPKLGMEIVIEKLSEITANRYMATGISKANTGEIVIKPGKFGILPGLTEPDVLKAMQQAPGIVSIDETVSNISVRGGTHDQNLFLWNGIRMFQTGHFFGLISAFNPLLATNISISKNGSSAFFGESVSSLVDISSHTKVTDSCYNVITADMISANFFSKIRLSNKATIQASGRRTFTDIVTTPTFKRYQDRVFKNTTVTDFANGNPVRIDSDEDFQFYDISIQYHRKIGEKHDLIIDGIGVENSVDVRQLSNGIRTDRDLRQRNFGGSATWKTKWNDFHDSEFQAFGSWYDFDARNKMIASGLRTENGNNVLDLGFRLRHSYAITAQTSISAGYQFDRISIRDEVFSSDPILNSEIDNASTSHALAVEGQFNSPDSRVNLRAGLRTNYYSKYDLLLAEPRIVFGFMFSKKLRVEILGERKSQTVSQLVNGEQELLGLESRRWALADEADIPIQKSGQFSIGFLYNDSGWLVSLDNFYKKISGITSDSQGFRNQFEFVSANGDYRVLGSELLVQKSFGRFLSWISYSFNDNSYDFGPFSPSRFPNNYSISHAASWAGMYEWNKLRFALGMNWHTGRPITTPGSFFIDVANPGNSSIVFNEPNNERLDDYVQCNLSASKSWEISKVWRITGNASILNFLDRENVLNRYYRLNRENNTVESVKVDALGRTVNFGIRLDF